MGAMITNAAAYGAKVERVGREKFMVQDGTVQGLIDNRILVKAEGGDVAEMLKVVETIDFRELVNVTEHDPKSNPDAWLTEGHKEQLDRVVTEATHIPIAGGRLDRRDPRFITPGPDVEPGVVPGQLERRLLWDRLVLQCPGDVLHRR